MVQNSVKLVAINIMKKSKPIILTDEHMRPGMEVEMHLRKYGHLPSLGCCEHDQPTKTNAIPTDKKV